METQTQRILVHLVNFRSITANEASALYGCNRLAARIAELRRENWDIKTEYTTGLNRYGEKVRFGKYLLN